MKKFYLQLYLLPLILLSCMMQRAEAVQLNGIYTIDTSLAATTTNFKDFRSAVIYLRGSGTRPDGGPSNSAPFGVSGPVAYNVASGIYTFSSTIEIDSITGSTSNKVIFDGGNAAMCILTGNVGNNPLLRLKECRYVEFRNFTIANSYSGTCAGIAIIGNNINDAGSGCTVKNCIVNLPNIGTNNSIGIGVTSNTNGYSSSGVRSDYVEIENNTINGGSSGIQFAGSSSGAYNSFCKVNQNTVSGAYQNGIDLNGIYNALEVIGNTISMNPSGSTSNTGININNCQNNSGAFSHVIMNNRTRFTAQYGININSANGTTIAPTKVYNNMIGSGFNNTNSLGLRVQVSSNSYYTEVYHNTVVYDAVNVTGSNIGAFVYGGSANLLCKNNIFLNLASSGSAYAAVFTTNPNSGGVDYNIYWNKSSQNFIRRNNQDFTSLNLNTSAAGGISSIAGFAEQDFVSLTDLHITNTCSPTGLNLSSFLPNDIDGHSRNATPTIGCDQPVGVATAADVSLLGVMSPSTPYVTGPQNIKVKFKNVGTNNLTSCSFALKVNNVLISTFSYTGSILPCAIDSFTFSTPYTFPDGTNQLQVYAVSVNGLADIHPNNDTLRLSVYGSLSGGTYTIDSSITAPQNFRTFTDAVNALKAGISGPIVFNIASGTYTISTTLSIDSILGSSSINTVIFDGGNGNAASRILIGNIASNPVVRLNQCKYVTFQNLTITNTYNNSCAGITIVGNNSNNAGSGCAIINCVVNLPNVVSQTSAAISITNASNGYNTSDVRVDSVLIQGNLTNNGYYGIMCGGSSNALYNRYCRVSGNTIQNANYTGIYMNGFYNAVELTGNTINMSVSGTNSRGIHVASCVNTTGPRSHNISGNKISNAAQYGFYLDNVNGPAAYPTKIYNNMIGGGFRNNNAIGLYLNIGSSYNAEVYHNTVVLDVENVSSQSVAAFYYTGSSGLLCRNNIFANLAASGNALPVYITATLPANALNANSYINRSSSNYIYRGGIIYNQLSFKLTSSGGDSSFAGKEDPWFASKTDLHLSNNNCNKGLNLGFAVPTDIDGQARSSAPDIGCDELNAALLNDVSMQAILSPYGAFNGMQTIKVKFKNNGSTVLTQCNFTLKINNTLISTASYSGSLATCSEDSIAFPIGFNFNGGPFNVVIYSDQPNTMLDDFRSNDTLKATFYGALSGGVYTIDTNGTGPNNFISFQAAVSALNMGGITGPVLFNVAADTFYLSDALIIGNIPGSSAVNTITFDGGAGNAASRILLRIYSINPIANNNPVILLNQCQSVRLLNLTIRNADTVNFVRSGVSITTNIGGGLCQVKNCIISRPLSSTGQGTGIGLGISETGIVSIAGTEVEIDSNLIINYSAGIQVTGTTNAFPNLQVKIRSNNIYGVRFDGILVNKFWNSGEVLGNDIYMDKSYSTVTNLLPFSVGINITSNTNGYIVSGNKVRYAHRGIVAPKGISGFPQKVYNNMVIGGLRGIEVGSQDVEVFHNSVKLDDLSTYDAPNFHFCLGSSGSVSSNLLIKNNIFINRAPKGISVFLDNLSLAAGAINYNVYYNEKNPILIQKGGIQYNSSTYNSPSVGGDSSFIQIYLLDMVSDTDLHYVSSCVGVNKGVDLSSSVGFDIDGQPRSTTPDIGCDEAAPTVFSEDVAVFDLLQPKGIFNGVQSVKVKFKNLGSNPLSSCTFTLKVNNSIVTTYSYSDTLPSCGVDSFTFPVTFNFVQGTSYDVQVYSSNPNTTMDLNRSNDTLKYTMDAALSAGIYTIDSNGTGPNNFVSFAAAIDVLKKGVLGPVTFMIAADTISFTAPLNIPEIPGTSSINRVTFDGGNGSAATRVLTGNIGNNPVVRLNLCKYVEVRNLSIVNTSSGACQGIAVVGNPLTNAGTGCRVKKCMVSLPNLTTSALKNISSKCIYIYGGNNGANDVGHSADSIEIDSNTVYNACYGIVNTGILQKGSKARYNIVNNVYTGISFGANSAIDISYNTFSMVTSGTRRSIADAAISAGGTNTSTISSTIVGNKIIEAGWSGNGFNLNNIGVTAGAPTIIANNLISGNFKAPSYAGLSVSTTSGSYVKILHNTVVYNQPYQVDDAYGALTIYGSGNVEVKNNLILSTSKDTLNKGYALFAQNTQIPGNINYNMYYNAATEKLLKIGDTIFNISNFKTISTGGDSSFNGLPDFASATDLHVMNVCDMRGVNYTSIIPVDLDGATRPALPSLGCFESVNTTTDIKMLRFLNPSPVPSGAQNIKVSFRNGGSSVLTSARFYMNVNGVIVDSFLYSGSLVSCGIDSFQFSGGFTFKLGNSQVLVYAVLPNNIQDPVTSNDTLSIRYYIPLSGGVYTINPAGSGPNNFVSFTAAAMALQAGVNGPIVFTVAPGVYNEQVNLVNIPGLSAANTVVFDGGNAVTAIVQYTPADPEYPYTWLIQNSPYITLRHLTIKNLAGSFQSYNVAGVAIQVLGASHFTKIKQCNIECLARANGGIRFSNYIDRNNLTVLIDSCEVDSNRITQTSYAVYFVGAKTAPYSRNNKFRYNTLVSSWIAFHVSGVNGVEISHNNSSDSMTLYNTLYSETGAGIFVDALGSTNGNNTVVIVSNYIYSSNGGGIGVSGGNSNGYRSLIANNMVSGPGGIGLDRANDFDIFHNTVVFSAPQVNRAGRCYRQFGTERSNIRNNYFLSKTNVGIPFEIQSASLSVNNDVDYNVFSRMGQSTGLIKLEGIEYTAANFVGALGYNLHSINRYIPLQSGTDLHLRDVCVPLGDTSSYISVAIGGVDLDGEVRGATPEIGADDLIKRVLDIGVDTIMSPTLPGNGLMQVVVRIKNYGNTTVSSAVVKYAVNGGTPQSLTYTGSLSPCDTVSVVFPVAYNFISGNGYTLKVWTSDPNSAPDLFAGNDTINISFCAALSGNYTINPSGIGSSNYISIAAAIDALYCAGINGPVIFNMSSGTYNESMDIFDDINGVSDLNTITFQSLANHADSVLLRPLSNASRYVVNLNASYIRFNALTFAPPASYSYLDVFHFDPLNLPSYIVIENCKVIHPGNTTTKVGIHYDWGNETAGKNITVRNNSVFNCPVGIRFAAMPGFDIVAFDYADSILIEGNRIFNPGGTGYYNAGIETYATKRSAIRNNIIKAVDNNYVLGIYASYIGLKGEVSGNILNGANLALTRIDNGIVSNNVVSIVNTSNSFNSTTGLQINDIRKPPFDSTDMELIGYTSVCHNSIRIKSRISGAVSAQHNGTFYNNIVSVEAEDGRALWNRNPGLLSDFNNLHTTTPVVVSVSQYLYTPVAYAPNPVTNYSDIATTRTGANKELHSISYRPGFMNDTNLVPNPADSASWSLNGRGNHSAVTTDINGNPRPINIAQGAPDIGAYEFTPTSIPPAAVATPATPISGGTQVFTFGQDKVGEITWAPASSVPSSVSVRQYSGEKPPSIVSTAEHMYMYTTVDMPNPGVAPNYTVSLKYRDSWLGTVANPNENGVKLAKKVASSPWLTLSTSSIDTNANTLSASGNTELSATFSAANVVHPLPVKLLTLTATNLKGDVHVNWATATEVNSSYFIVERALDSKSFKAIGKVKAQGNSSNVSNYELLDTKAPFGQSSTLYYRLRIVDADGSYEYSDIVSVSEKQVTTITKPVIYPNPFNDEVFAAITLEEAAKVKVILMDITGKEVQSNVISLGKGQQTLKLFTEDLRPGMYFLEMDIQGVVYTQKIIKH